MNNVTQLPMEPKEESRIEKILGGAIAIGIFVGVPAAMIAAAYYGARSGAATGAQSIPLNISILTKDPDGNNVRTELKEAE